MCQKTINNSKEDRFTDILALESENVEFKEAKNSYEFDNPAKYACSVSNLGGGRVVFGITDKRPRMVVGSLAFEQPERTRKGLIDKLHVRVDFRFYVPTCPNRVSTILHSTARM